ncbi:MAG: hypothetical protein WAU68_08880 [Vitreimonas sp.]
MGLRPVAHYYDRVEALVVSSALDAAGVPNFVENFNQVAVKPFEEIALGGYRLMVCEQDLQYALEVIDEARAKPSFEGERLSTYSALELSLLLMLALSIVTSIPIAMFIPFRWHRWHPVD